MLNTRYFGFHLKLASHCVVEASAEVSVVLCIINPKQTIRKALQYRAITGQIFLFYLSRPQLTYINIACGCIAKASEEMVQMVQMDPDGRRKLSLS